MSQAWDLFWTGCVVGTLSLLALQCLVSLVRPAKPRLQVMITRETRQAQAIPTDSLAIVAVQCEKCDGVEMRAIGASDSDYEKQGWRLIGGKWQCPYCNGLRNKTDDPPDLACEPWSPDRHGA